MVAGVDLIQEEGDDTSVGRRGEKERGRVGEEEKKRRREEERGRSDEPKTPLGKLVPHSGRMGVGNKAKVKF